MAGDVANPRVWLNADVYVAPVGTTAPTDTSTAWTAAWLALGLLGEDGLTESRSEDRTDHYAWGGLLVRTVRSRHTRSFSVTVLEDTPTVFGLVNPGSTASTLTGTTTRVVKSPTADPRAFGFETKDGTVVSRIVIPKGEVITVGDATRSESGLYTRDLTINVYPASDGTLYREITNDPQAVVV